MSRYSNELAPTRTVLIYFMLLMPLVIGLSACDSEPQQTQKHHVNDLSSPVMEPSDKLVKAITPVAPDFMNIPVNGEFSCKRSMQEWDPHKLTDAISYIREYEEFKQYVSQNSLWISDRAVDDNKVRNHLVLLLNDVMRDAQIQTQANELNTQAVTTALENSLRISSRNFAKVIPLLLYVLQASQRLENNINQQEITACIHDYATNRLVAIRSLIDKSKLYQPNVTNNAGNNANTAFYDLGSAAKTQSYLTQQFNRVSILANYADPFVRFIVSVREVRENVSKNEAELDYWRNTILQVAQKVKFKDSTSQAVTLDRLILNEIRMLTPNNCDKLVLSKNPIGEGNSLFYERWRLLTQQVSTFCNEAKKANTI